MKMTLLFALLFAALPASAADCPASYQDPAFKQVWDLSRSDWDTGCKTVKDPSVILSAAKTRFAKECLEDAERSIEARLISREEAEKLCAQGTPGKVQIPKPKEEGPQGGRAAADKRVGLFSEKVIAHIKGDIAALYGEKSLKAETAVDGPYPVMTPGPSTGRPEPPARGLATIAPPSPGAAPNPARDKNIAILQSYIVPHGAGPEAVATTKKLMAGMLGQADPVVVQHMVDERIHVIIIPKDKKLTDLPEFAYLKGKKTIDGRPWEKVRGIGDTRLKDGSIALGVAEETLTGTTGYHRGHVFVHELGHIVQDHGLPRGLKNESDRIYNDAVKRKTKTGLGKYADSNTSEHFAQATAAYLGVSISAATTRSRTPPPCARRIRTSTDCSTRSTALLET